MKYRIIRENGEIKVQVKTQVPVVPSPFKISSPTWIWETITRTIIYAASAAEVTDIFENIEKAREYIEREIMKEKHQKFEILEEFDSEDK